MMKGVSFVAHGHYRDSDEGDVKQALEDLAEIGVVKFDKDDSTWAISPQVKTTPVKRW